MELKEIQNLIKFVAKSGASEVKLETDDIKITIRTDSGEKETTIVHQTAPIATMPQITQSQPAEAPAASAPPTDGGKAEQAPTTSDEDRYVTIKSPIIGTFYRRPSPDKPIFAEVGDDVKEGDTLCIIEAMKLFNEIESEVSGRIVKVLAEDSTPVEFDQPLFLVDPS